MSSDVTYDLALLHKSAAKWRSSAALRSVYGDILREVERQLAPGRSLEIGSGIGTIKDFLPDVVASDIAVTPDATAVRTEQGFNSNTFLMKRAQVPRAVFAAAISSESEIRIGPSGCFSSC